MVNIVYSVKDVDMKRIVKITIEDEAYPEKLRQIKRPPRQLYCIGNTGLLKEEGVAVVGARRCSFYGYRAACEIGKRIADGGLTLISGMAAGIDAGSHKGCLEAGGRTIAVLGTGIDICYPKSNADLYERIASEGLVVSEYGPGDRTGPWAFPERNRIISGLSECVIVVEGTRKSGSMITANFALEQGKDVYAVPGNIDQANAEGVNMLIRDGAMPIISFDDLPEILGIGESRAFRNMMENASEEEKQIIRYVKSNPGSESESISFSLLMEKEKVSALLRGLEMKGYIKRSGKEWFPM